MLVSPFTFYRGRGGRDGRRPRGDADSGLRVQFCGDAHLANFGGFAARPRDGVRHQRLRRDAARARGSGTSSAWRRASRSSARPRVRRRAAAAAVARRGARVPPAHARLRGAWPTSTSGTPGSTSRPARAVCATRCRRGARKKARAGASPRRESKDRLRAFARSSPTRRRRAAVRERSAAGRADRGPSSPSEGGEPDERAVSRSPSYRRHLHPTAVTCSTATGRRRRPQGGRRRQRRHAALGRAAARPRHERPALPAGQGGRGVGAGAYAGPSSIRQHGRRVVDGQRLMQAASDIFLGWMTARRRRTASSTTSTCANSGTAKISARRSRRWTSEGLSCLRPASAGAILARAHARTVDRIAVASYLGSGAQVRPAIARFAVAYADQNERDHHGPA